MTRRELAEMMFFFCAVFMFPQVWGCVTDDAQLFTPDQVDVLGVVCHELYEQTSVVFWVYTLSDSADITMSARSFFESHQLGDEQTDSGFLLVIDSANQQYYFLPGYGIDRTLSAGMLGRFIRETFEPVFSEGSYYLGVLYTIDFLHTVVGDSVLTSARINWWIVIVVIASICLTLFVYIRFRIFLPLMLLDIWNKRGGKTSGGGLARR
jgi:uncharacterized membrane protein YgcG